MKAKFLFICCITAIIHLSVINSFGQIASTKGQPATSIYLHTDRVYYLPGESILFKAYILDDSDNRSNTINDTLHLELIDQDGLMVAAGIFPLNNSQMRGKIELPDFLTEGNYILVAFSSLTNNPLPKMMFSRVIEIRKAAESNLITDLSLTETQYESHSSLTALIKFSDKDNKTVPVNFNYQLTGISGEILTGKSKSDDTGIVTLKLQLPEFDNKETLKLIVAPSYKGTKTITGIVIPTRYNSTAGKGESLKNQTTNEFRHLNIEVKPVTLSSGQDGKIHLDISVTDDKGMPAMANLSVSVSNIVFHQLSYENDNIISYANHKNYPLAVSSNSEINKYYAQYLLKTTLAPGCPYVVQEKNDAKKLRRKQESDNQKNQMGYSSDRNIFDILMQIKPYHLDNNKITFGVGGMNSINNVEGALIIVDGVKMGTDASLLNNIPVPDIARITASTNVIDIQRYSAMNSSGIIEIFMKKNAEFVKNEQTVAKTKSNTLLWEPDIITDSSGKASVDFMNNNKSAEVLISIEGVAANGLSGSNSFHYTIK